MRGTAQPPARDGLPRRASSPHRLDASPRRLHPALQAPLEGDSWRAPSLAAVHLQRGEHSSRSRGLMPQRRLPSQQPAEQRQAPELLAHPAPATMPPPSHSHGSPGRRACQGAAQDSAARASLQQQRRSTAGGMHADGSHAAVPSQVVLHRPPGQAQSRWQQPQAGAPGGDWSSGVGISVPVQGRPVAANAAAAAAAAKALPAARREQPGPGASDDSSASGLAPHLSPDAAAGRKRSGDEAPQASGELPPWPHQAALQQQQQQEPVRAQQRPEVCPSKHDAAASIKDLLKPLLREGIVDRELFRKAARRATHTVCRGDARSARDALGEALAELDAQGAAVAVLRAA